MRHRPQPSRHTRQPERDPAERLAAIGADLATCSQELEGLKVSFDRAIGEWIAGGPRLNGRCPFS